MKNFFLSVAPIIHEVGDNLAKSFGNIEAISQKTSSPGDVVTELDQAAEKAIAERLHALYPSIKFVGEEFGGDPGAERFWLCDPIDGTADFIRGIPFCTTQIALIEEGQVIFSLIYNFVTREMFSAQKGMGAILNGRPMHVSRRPLKDAYVCVETHREKKQNLDKFMEIDKQCPTLAMVNNGFDFSLVASGKIDAKVCFDPYGKDWDYAPGSLLVSEAGGIVKNLGSDSYDYRNHDFIAGNPVIYDELKKLF
jgi:myo-inositol-1(or 4)-monophosphatase